MRIGFDFDNTIVSYDELFHKVAVEKKLVPPEIPKNKIAVRDYLRKIDNEDAWTEMQGYVYGARMEEAEMFPGVIDFMNKARDAGISMIIVSHKTKYPFLGEKYDLHKAARSWIENNLISMGEDLIQPNDIFFETTKQNKIARIAKNSCDYFVDDLPEILNMDGFPDKTSPILFDPDKNHSKKNIYTSVGSWVEMNNHFKESWLSC